MSKTGIDFMQGRASTHQGEVQAFLQAQYGLHQWELTRPHGWGKESYFARGGGQNYFVKLGAPVANYQAMASLGLTPPVIAQATLEDGTTLLVQPYIEGRKPSWVEFRTHLERFALIIKTMHHSEVVRQVLPEAFSSSYHLLGLDALNCLRQRWEQHKALVPAVARWVDENLDLLARQIESLEGSGVVATHNDICNANWLVTPDKQIYVIDLDAMSMDDPAVDFGAILWWYYPPRLRRRFLEIAGIDYDESLRNRMRLRMAIHCLEILFPRQDSLDRFDKENFGPNLSDFRAIIEGQENPHGYRDE